MHLCALNAIIFIPIQALICACTLTCSFIIDLIHTVIPIQNTISNYCSLPVDRPGPLPPLSPVPLTRNPSTANLQSPMRNHSIRTEPPTLRARSSNIFDAQLDAHVLTPSAPSRRPRTLTVLPRSPSPDAQPDNFIRPTDVDENGHLLANITTFPRRALKIMQDWKEHLPMHILTEYAIQEANRMPSSDIQYAQTSADGSLTLVTKGPNNRDEFKLTETDWRFAIPNYLRLITYHCTRDTRIDIVRGLQKHFAWISTQPDYYKDFLLYLRYDIKIRGFIANTKYVPTGYEPNIFNATREEYNRELARNLIVSNPGNLPGPSTSGSRGCSRSASPRRNLNSFQSSSRGNFRGRPFRPYSGSTTRVFCIACGQYGHASYACQSNKAPFLVKDKSGRWLGPEGAQLCYKWNNDSSTCQGCNREHRCTLCGNQSHNARKCSRLPA